MKVYVVTKAEVLQPEIYVSVRSTMKDAEKAIRAKYPNAKKDPDSGPQKFNYLCKDGGHESLMFVTVEELH